ncbi:alpha/beta hydrolase [Halobacteriales archaeon QS_1_68_17]|nr:MAG: alpha/beta hydrolase [Halobacteriales archaeon QS_1_68_17]
MKLRNVVGAAAGLIGGAALSNRLLSARAGDLDPPLPGDQHTYRWRGFDVSYTEAGDPDDPDLLLIHGVNAAASSNEFRAVFDRLAETHHVVAPDLPGFGLSDRPPLLYSGSLYTTFVSDFAADVVEDAVCVGSSLSGAYAAVAAGEVDFARLVLVCPTATTMPGGRRVWLRSLFRSPLVGRALFNALASKYSIRTFNADHGYYDPANITDEVVDYEWRTAHQPGARFAPASFVSGFLDLDVDLGDVLADIDEPVTLVWGREADITPLSAGRDLAERADARLVVFDESLLLPHVEHPEEFVDVVTGDI